MKLISQTAKGRYYKVYRDGEYVSQHTTEREASETATNLAIEFPQSSISYTHEYEVQVALTTAGATLFNANSPVSANYLLNEGFSSNPLSATPNDPDDGWYDTVSYVSGTLPLTSTPSYYYEWEAGDSGTNGQAAARYQFTPQTEMRVSFQYNSQDAFDAGTGHHLIYIRSNFEGPWDPPTDGYTLYIEPQDNGEFYVDLRRALDPADWQIVYPSTSVSVDDGANHTITVYMKANSQGNEDGTLTMDVDGIRTINRVGDIELFQTSTQAWSQLNLGPYINGGTSHSSAIGIHVADLKIEGLQDAGETTRPGALEFATSSVSVGESAGSLVVTVSRTDGGDGAVSVSVDSENGTAVAGSDFTAVSTTLDFADGEFSKTFSVTISDDAIAESTEAFTLVLSSPTGGATLGSNTTMTVNIVDDDAVASAVLSVNNPTVTPNDSSIDVTVRLAEIRGVDTPFTYATSDGLNMAAGVDYTSTSGSSSVPAGQLFKKITVPIAGNRPTGDRGYFTFTVTDEDTNQVTARCNVIHSVLNWDMEGLGSIGSRPIKTRHYNSDTYMDGQWVTTLKGGATLSEVDSDSGQYCMRMPYDDSQHDVGTSVGGSGPRVGHPYSGNTIYFRCRYRVSSDFEFRSNGNEEAKWLRLTNVNEQTPEYTTWLMSENDMLFGQNYTEPGSGVDFSNRFNSSWTDKYGDGNKSQLVDPTDKSVSEWREYVFEAKMDTGASAGDGELRLYIDGVLCSEETGAQLADLVSHDSGDLTFKWSKGLGAWIYPQSTLNGSSDPDVGGVMYGNDQNIAYVWNSAIYEKPE